ncbi:hypothetical protein BJ138DRAFT_1112685 [Hygrophoropsis aurantiaca]|uniref:Uncharacterized protein n=1 Tax=Hygrophoropsis aurantiaca TaxID=72124 RepID=A0ACB8AFS1_9AGAM|nr:hypothetical protein BJ138DRAFT_1112685 [Hygrophoropsis aurantiaca]
MSSPSPTRDSEPDERRTMNAIEQIPSASGRHRAHQTAYLSGMTDEVPSPSDMEVNQYRVVHACYEVMEGQAATEGSSQSIYHEISAALTLTTVSQESSSRGRPQGKARHSIFPACFHKAMTRRTVC